MLKPLPGLHYTYYGSLDSALLMLRYTYHSLHPTLIDHKWIQSIVWGSLACVSVNTCVYIYWVWSKSIIWSTHTHTPTVRSFAPIKLHVGSDKWSNIAQLHVHNVRCFLNVQLFYIRLVEHIVFQGYSCFLSSSTFCLVSFLSGSLSPFAETACILTRTNLLVNWSLTANWSLAPTCKSNNAWEH